MVVRRFGGDSAAETRPEPRTHQRPEPGARHAARCAIQTASWELPADAHSVGWARSLTREALVAWGVGDAADTQDVVLMVDELMTNAVVHGGGPIRLALRVEAGTLVGEVSDGSPVLPRSAGPFADGEWGRESGRGLWLVALLAADHGVRPEGTGKTMWFSRVLAS